MMLVTARIWMDLQSGCHINLISASSIFIAPIQVIRAVQIIQKGNSLKQFFGRFRQGQGNKKSRVLNQIAWAECQVY